VRFVDNVYQQEIVASLKTITDDFEILAMASAVTQSYDQFLKIYRKIAEQEMGKRVNYSKSEGTSDARFFSEKGASAIVTNIDCGNIHAKNEWVDIGQIDIFYKILIKFIKEITSVVQ
jgi:acetylornithine deacetylase/succinyl-diaminopimelate desuccinylase-like protein